MSLSPPKNTINFPIRKSRLSGRDRIQDILVRKGAVSPEDMFKAIALQSHENVRLSEMLQGLGYADEDMLLAAASEQTALPIVDLYLDPPTKLLEPIVPPIVGLRNRFVVWKNIGNALVVAVSEPADIEGARKILAGIAPAVQFVLASHSSIVQHYRTKHSAALSLAANLCVAPELSCRKWSGSPPRVIGGVLLSAIITATLVYPNQTLLFGFYWVLIALVANGAFKAAMFVCHLRQPIAPINPKRTRKLPKISILLPLLREEDIVDRLVTRMSALVYPKELLEICLVYEEDDVATRNHLSQKRLPYWMKTIQVPRDGLQTKPRAMNFALDFCSGDIVGVYDAEDAPQPRQLHAVARMFDKADETVACVQCQLDFYNSTTNWISRCFTIEYAILFRIILPGLTKLKLPVPLGGTSVFFRRDILEKLGRWDAYNVTEDADLGIRLHRLGYQCLWANTTTYEEANFRLLPWVRQRSRWLKGFLQTWITHMRSPIKLLRQIGPLGFLVFQVQMLGTVTSFAAVPLVLPMWLYSLGFQPSLYEQLPDKMLYTLIFSFILTECLLLVIGAVAVRRQGTKSLYWYLPTMLLYWPLGCFAAYKALWELFVHPSFWDKTTHGINDFNYQAEIERLTASPDVNENLYSPALGTAKGG
jgi:cellulose synthase/poly-beta-1,6-N-acetylglucosamine synthase-like glycosyltransferase